MDGIISAWGRILGGYKPTLSIEITRECPLRCPGCYAYGEDHLGGPTTLRQLHDFKGQELIDGVHAASLLFAIASSRRCCLSCRRGASTCRW